jgi:hypothetical protein
MVNRWIVASIAVALIIPIAACSDPAATPDACVGRCDALVPDASVDSKPIDAAIDANPLMPAKLRETGLCANASCSVINPGILSYTPRWPLFIDGASKKRWLYLPPGTKIDTAEMSYWRFPVGTKLWKEFTRDNIRVETRLMMKVGPLDSEWFMVSFGWNATQDDAVALPNGKLDANGTMHDIPSRNQCRLCHDRTSGRVLGFSALELDVPAANGEVALNEMIASNSLTVIPPGAGATKFPLPGVAQDQAALGYLHANCGHCHNPRSDVHDAKPIELMLQTDRLATLAATPTYTTAVNVDGGAVGGVTKLIKPGDTDGSQSVLMLRFNTTSAGIKMPLLGTETIDQAAVTLLKAWISSIPPN